MGDIFPEPKTQLSHFALPPAWASLAMPPGDEVGGGGVAGRRNPPSRERRHRSARHYRRLFSKAPSQKVLLPCFDLNKLLAILDLNVCFSSSFDLILRDY
ncbi:hypothetical protein L1987_17107 [Smallanthus sonchifolius]|uniref:Uncharacterized protein n=1 Tax=Smallanthus sonchifolius TaxID=185202 RepID=A0ACB9IWK6_9ASTR|nr:hypothetical protein L1987_17107 [Smallanthus sonchifolius]